MQYPWPKSETAPGKKSPPSTLKPEIHTLRLKCLHPTIPASGSRGLPPGLACAAPPCKCSSWFSRMNFGCVYIKTHVRTDIHDFPLLFNKHGAKELPYGTTRSHKHNTLTSSHPTEAARFGSFRVRWRLAGAASREIQDFGWNRGMMAPLRTRHRLLLNSLGKGVGPRSVLAESP